MTKPTEAWTLGDSLGFLGADPAGVRHVTIETMKRRARQAATKTEAGTAEVGRVAVRYYPRSGTYNWWIDGECGHTLGDVALALRR